MPIDTSVIFRGGLASPVTSYNRGQQTGLANMQSRQTLEANDETMGRNSATYMKGLAQVERMNQAISSAPENIIPADMKQVLLADPELAKEWFKQKIAGQMKIKNALPDNEWIDDPKDAEYQIYVEKTTDPTTRQPVMKPIPGMRKRKGFMDRRDFEREKIEAEREMFNKRFKQDEEQFTAKNVLDNQSMALKWQAHKIDKINNDFDLAKKEFEFRQKKEGIISDFRKEATAVKESLKTIDEMIGSEDGKIKRHKGFKTSVGRKGFAYLGGLIDEPFAGSAGADFMAKYKKITGKVFMQAFTTLKGGGQITEVEGQKATQSLLEMQVAQSEEEFIKSARDYQFYIKEGFRKKAEENARKLGNTGAKIQVNSRADVVKFLTGKLGKKPTMKQIDQVMRNAGLK